ncbi:DUF2225 domain-containing protein [Brevibacillus humidisoli]|uniref:DUF2225 domain-containing protein n=1 Tax=Brevibacillus humidisoli TaxID=2895522 RepID=UPI001E4AEC3D|nr:DUF2225 domain-containing protein [Brevibacillus humidisoli]UFJ43324.1 DUF2225 domain-containing protein [Brevibacillus humidisoli]
MDLLYDKTVTCLYCDHTFPTKKVRQGMQAAISRDTDFCTYYKEQQCNPILYTVSVCPQCGFSFTEHFSTTLTPQARELVKQQIAAKWQKKQFGSLRSIKTATAAYKLALHAAVLTDQPHSIKAGLCLRLSWLYRFLQDEAEEQRFIQFAAEEYERSYEHSDYVVGDKEMSEVRMLYLIGELKRRIGSLDDAVRYFSKVVQMKGETIETGIVHMAQEQWSLARQAHSEQRKQHATS